MLQQLADEFYPMLEPQSKQVCIDVPDTLIAEGAMGMDTVFIPISEQS